MGLRFFCLFWLYVTVIAGAKMDTRFTFLVRKTQKKERYLYKSTI